MKAKPTMRLRWVESYDEEENTVCVMVKKYVIDHYKLQQYWQYDDEKGEWIDIPIEHNSKDTDCL